MSLQGRHFSIVGSLVPLATMLLAAPAGAAETSQQDRFAAAFEPPPTEPRAVCDAILRLPPSPIIAVSEVGPQVEAAPTDGPPADVVAPEEGLAVPEIIPPPQFLASVGIPVLHTQYDARWRSVQESGLSLECASYVLDRETPPASPQELAEFNRLINQITRYVADGARDEWASAADTLRSGQGDCEDIAILKLQLLLAVGLPEDDVYFTLVRDTMRRRDHAVAVVRIGGRSWLLDSLDDALLDADQSAGAYQAVVTFSGTRTWLLGTGRQAINAVPLDAPAASARSGLPRTP